MIELALNLLQVGQSQALHEQVAIVLLAMAMAGEPSLVAVKCILQRFSVSESLGEQM